MHTKIKNDRLDSEALEFHNKVRTGYLTLAKIRPNWAIIPADNSIELVAQNIWQKVSEVLDL